MRKARIRVLARRPESQTRAPCQGIHRGDETAPGATVCRNGIDRYRCH
jgi:hypothetical protein